MISCGHRLAPCGVGEDKETWTEIILEITKSSKKNPGRIKQGAILKQNSEIDAQDEDKAVLVSSSMVRSDPILRVPANLIFRMTNSSHPLLLMFTTEQSNSNNISRY